MPVSSIDCRNHCGEYDIRRNKKHTPNATQKKLNQIANTQQHKMPQQFGVLSLLCLSYFILPNLRMVIPGIAESGESDMCPPPRNHTLSVSPPQSSISDCIESIISLTPQAIPPHIPSPPPFWGFSFPMAQASTLPQLDVIQRDEQEGVLIATGDDGKRLMINLAKSFLINLGTFSSERINHMEHDWLIASAGNPLILARVPIAEKFQRDKRISMSDRNKIITQHIVENCAFEEEIYNPDGTKEGEMLMFMAQRIDNPFRMLYDDIPGYTPSTAIEYTSAAGNYIVNILTLGFKSLIGNFIANLYRRKYYKMHGDDICADRQLHINFANIATSLDVGGVPFSMAKRKITAKPIELRNIIPLATGPAFVIRNKQSHVDRSLWLSTNIPSTSKSQEKVILTPKSDKEFESVPESQPGPKSEKKRVVFDEADKIWSFADDVNKTPLHIDIEEGSHFISLYGEKYHLNVDKNLDYEIVAHTLDGLEHHFPVYQDPLSGSWHLKQLNGHPVYPHYEKKIIEKIKVEADTALRYDAIEAISPDVNGNGVLFEVRNIHDDPKTTSPLYLVVEMNGVMVPARTAIMQGHGVRYSAYDIHSPLKSGYRLEWNGERWHMEKWTSPHISKSLNSVIPSAMFATDVPLRQLSATDHRGVRWAENRGFIRVRGHYVEVHQGNLIRLGPKEGKQLGVQYKDSKFYPLSMREIRERTYSITSDELVERLKNISQDQLKSKIQFTDLERAVRTLSVKSSLSDGKKTMVSEMVNASMSEYFRPEKTTPVVVEAVPSNTVNKNRFLVTIGENDYFFVEISEDGLQVRVLTDDEETLAMEKHLHTMSGGDIKYVASLRRDEVLPIVKANTRSEIDITAQERIRSGAAILQEVLEKMLDKDTEGKTLLVADVNFLKTAEFENNIFPSPDCMYQALIDHFIPISRRFPNTILIPGAVHISQDIPQNMLLSALIFESGNNVRSVRNFVNMNTILVPVMHHGKIIAMVRKGNYLTFKKKNAPLETPAAILPNMDNIPWGSTIISPANQNNHYTDFSDLHESRVGAINVGKTLLPGEYNKAEWFFCPCPEINGTDSVVNFFSNVFMIDDEKFKLVFGDEVVESSSSTTDVKEGSLYDWVINVAADDVSDENIQHAGYNYIKSNALSGAEYYSTISQRRHLVSYSPEKKLTLFEYITDQP